MSERLKAAADKLGSMAPSDRNTVVVVGAELEETTGQIPREWSALRDLLYLCLQCLQKVYESGGDGCGDLLAAVAGALNLAGNLPGEEAACERELSRAREALASQLEPAPPTLDAIAAKLVQLEPGDAEGLGRIGRALGEARNSLAGELHGIIDEAIATINRACQQNLSDAAAIAQVGSLLERAMKSLDDKQSGLAGPVGGAAAPSPQVSASQPMAEAQPAACLSPEETLADADPGLVGEFVTESSEYVQGAEASLLGLEANPDDAEAVRTVFRAFHTIKGTSAFLGFNLVSEFAHRAENLLSRIRDGEIRYGGGYADLALRSIDMLKELLATVEGYAPGKTLSRPAGYDQLLTILGNPEAAGYSGEARGGPAEPAKDAAGAARQSTSGSETVETLRVSTERLDRLIDMVGELVIANSMVVQDEKVIFGSDQGLTRKVAHMAKIVRELQDHSMSMRMIPLRGTFQKMARVVRDVARKSGKCVKFVSDGGETEMDRNMVDVINDPLVHMLRNSVDHGIESPDERKRLGKPREGTVSISAYHSGGSVVIEIKDDGRGICRESVVRKALEKKLIQQDQVLTDSEVFSLIFEPGFSTAQKVTSVSGRGVGLDVVKKGIDALRGRIEVRSEAGKGCTFLLRVPLTMAIIDGMVVTSGAERYIIPALSVVRSLRPDAASIWTILEGGEVLSLDGDLLPLVRLGTVFDVKNAKVDPTEAIALVVEGEGRRAAVLVDDLLGKQQIVIKSLGKAFGQIKGISGGAIMPDGRVGLILDISSLLALAESKSASEPVPV
ncbi:MAG TPA: chemotaxis protein CheA [bacterium]|nr:chemotaxis protein CheA [bacterium]